MAQQNIRLILLLSGIDTHRYFYNWWCSYMAEKIYCDATEVLENIDNFVGDLPSILANGVEQATLYIEGEAKRLCPVDDGLLRASITHTVETNEHDYTATGYVGSNLEYAPYVHQGTGLYAIEGNGRKEVPWHYKDAEGKWHTTSGQKPQPFLQDAIDTNHNKLLKFFEGLLK